MSAEQEKTLASTETAVAQESLLEEIVQATRLKPADEAYSITRKGVEALISQLLEPGRETVKVSKAGLDDMIAEIDRKMSRQVDEILHHKDFQKLESAWRSLNFLVDRTDFRENTKIEILHVTKDELLDDFEDAAEIVKSGLYKTGLHQRVRPVRRQALCGLIGNYEFDAAPQDIKLLQYTAAVAAMSHAPFIAAAGARVSSAWRTSPFRTSRTSNRSSRHRSISSGSRSGNRRTRATSASPCPASFSGCPTARRRSRSRSSTTRKR